MDLLIIRHADAGDRDEFAKSGKPDHLRPLSDKGRRQMERGAPAFPALVPEPDLLLSSPFTRALQTAGYVRDAYGGKLDIETTDALEPERAPAELRRVLRGRDADTVIVVGHEPHLGSLATWLIAGRTDAGVTLKKGAACLIRLDGKLARDAGTLRWLVDVKMLRALADG